MTATRRSRVQRLLVALDASPHSVAALTAAGELASHLGIELLGLFVEDLALLELAELPFAREVGSYSATARPIDRGGLERQLRARGERLRAQLETTARQARVPCSFRTSRGAVAQELLAAASSTDLVCVGRVGWSRGDEQTLGSTTDAVVTSGSASVLILGRASRLGPRVLVVYDGSSGAEAALATAADLTRSSAGGPVVIVPADGEGLAEKAAHRMDELGSPGPARSIAQLTPDALCAAARLESAGLLVLPGCLDIARGASLRALLAGACCPVLIARA